MNTVKVGCCPTLGETLIYVLGVHTCRCGIPVVIMGETGCGKTRLIRFMCNLASQGSGHTNMLILKVGHTVKAISVLLVSYLGTWWDDRGRDGKLSEEGRGVC